MEQWDLSLQFRGGFSFDPINTSHSRVTIAMDAVHPSDNKEYVNSGIEYGFNEMFPQGWFSRMGHR